ncbi:hypothetical protein BO83DRAFT_377968 [Aspergillus eucalypticola CBS 122712]|uniref:Uncharacterized protein n=1 Tax=Aspergillus eucalypticola (strain CBS 122712 / IBT 29274) TaxID=1448314 RepID=A0A317VM57_ASPEC|nr:uncharacterized protein BO83DRAFT_377968 [Aspergillus eucalypticola CBS 122712]PWY74955.1 hypothetical protein BO83DRAFT_377968 [Aspergillus eucalypticola CBS 122712]
MDGFTPSSPPPPSTIINIIIIIINQLPPTRGHRAAPLFHDPALKKPPAYESGRARTPWPIVAAPVHRCGNLNPNVELTAQG